MNGMIKCSEAERMSSLQIAEITGKQHYNIMRDIRELLKQGVSKFNFELAKYSDKQGKPRQCYNLTKKGCLILASGYDALLREKIIDRLEELESAVRGRLYAELAERVQALETSVRNVRQAVPAMDDGVYVMRYSARAAVVAGNTYPLRERLRELGGRFCPTLRRGDGNGRFCGWVFPGEYENELRYVLADVLTDDAE